MSLISTAQHFCQCGVLLFWGLWIVGCTPPAQPEAPAVSPFFATDYNLPSSQRPDSLFAASVRQGVLSLTPLLADAPTWPEADSTIRAFLATYSETAAYAPLAQIAARAMIRHRLLADSEAMSPTKAVVMQAYLSLMYEQGSRDIVLMERGVDSLYILGQDSVMAQWHMKLEELAPPPPADAYSALPLPEHLGHLP